MKLSPSSAACLLAGTMIFPQSSHAAPKYEQNIDKSFAVTPGGQLTISAEMGTIRVTAGSSDKLEIHVLRTIIGGDKTEADDLFSRHEVTFTQDGNAVSVVAKDSNHSGWTWNSSRQNFEVTYEITAPSQFNLDFKTAGGDITLGDLDGKLTARTTSGSIRAGAITGALSADDAGGDISVKSVGKDASANTTSGSIEIQQSGGNAQATDAGGDIRIGEAGGTTIARTTSGSITVGSAGRDVAATDAGGDIHIDKAGGNVAVETTSGLIAIGSVKGDELRAEDHGGNIEIGSANGTVKVETTSGSIAIGQAGGPLEAQDAGGDIRIDKALNEVRLHTTSGSIHVGSAKGAVEARDAGGSIVVGAASKTVDAETTSGTIEVSFVTAPTSDSRLVVMGGDITVSAPASAPLDVDARSEGGSVESELPITVHGRTRDGELQGQINGGGPRLSLHCTSGDIRLKRSASWKKEADANQ